MLRAMVYINADIVDKLCMWNQGKINKKGQHKYWVWLESEGELSKLKNTGKIKVVWHRREDGWRELVIKSLKKLREKKTIATFQDSSGNGG